MDCSIPGFPVITGYIHSRSLPKLRSIKLVMPFNYLILSCPVFLLPSIFPSIRIFSNKSVLHIRKPYWSFSFSIRPSKEYSGFISFTIDWLDLLAVQGTLKSLLQHHSSKASILQIKDLLNTAPPIRTRSSFPLSLSLPSGSFHKPLILLYQRPDRLKKKKKVTENWSIWLHGPQPCLTQWNYEPCCVGPPTMDGSWWRGLTKRGPLEKGMANHFSILALRTPWTV